MCLDYFVGRDKAEELGYSFRETREIVCIDKVDSDGNVVCRGWFAPTRSNDKLLESYGVWVNFQMQKQGIGQKFLQDRMAVAKAMGAEALFASVSNTNLVQRHILGKYGWFQNYKLPYHDIWSVIL